MNQKRIADNDISANPKKINFTKMHGIGNDYIYVNLDTDPIEDLALFAKKQSDRHFGIGGDGLVTYNRLPNGNYRMRIFNTDGSEGMMCGNAIRCVAKLVYESGLCQQNPLQIETASGTKTLQLTLDEQQQVTKVRVDMGKPIIGSDHLEVTISNDHYVGTEVSMGNPHYVTVIKCDPKDYPLEEKGPEVEQHSLFPDRVNFEIIQVVDPHTLKMRVYERGSGLTLACGTGACASAVATIHHGLAKSPVEIHMPGGILSIEWSGKDEDSVFMTGPASIAFTGVVEI